MTSLQQARLDVAAATAERRRILLVEDEPDVREFVAASLRDAGFEVYEASDGVDALPTIEHRRPDLILCDLRMPRMGGLDLLKRLRAAPAMRDIPFVMLSGSSDTPVKVTCIESGASDYVTKPIEAGEIIARIRLQIRLACQLQELREKSYVDPLTGVYNRRGLVESLERELSRTTRSKQPLGLLLIDVDDFKGINDGHGHGVGDDVLSAVANALRAAVRASDVVGRLGGDEFAIVLPDVNERLASRIIHRVRGEMKRVTIPGTPRPVNLSIGMVCRRSRQMTTAELLERADRDMYRSKRRRRRLRALW